MTRLITFATEDMSLAAHICKESALRNNVTDVKVYGPEDIDAKFFETNREIFDQSRGFGYWLWKPHLIDRELQEMKYGDILIYADAGVEIINNVNHIIDRMDLDVFLFGNMWEHTHWCKGDVIKAICPRFQTGKQAQASVVVVKNGEWSRTFIAEWLYWCQKKGFIDDSPSNTSNHAEFQEHRHDQAIITSMAYRDKFKLHWWPAMYTAGNFTYEKTGYTDSYPVMFHHHRMRNDQFSAADDTNRHMQKYFKQKYPGLV